MEQKNAVKIILLTMGISVLMFLTVVLVAPFLNRLCAVEVQNVSALPVTQAPLPGKPKETVMTAYYQMEEGSRKISAIYIEVYHVGSNAVTYVEIPADTKVNLSEELYKSLQTYAPELPQYLKLSNMAESFSDTYGLTGCNRILSELTGVSLTDYVRAGKEALDAWLKAQQEQLTEQKYFNAYTKWMEASSSNKTLEERWMYYESRSGVHQVRIELAPGSREKDGYVLSGKRTGERLEELLLRTEPEPLPEN